MDTFRTELNPLPATYTITHRDPVMTLGSCFADAMGKKLMAAKFNTLVNPFGTTYNPLSIHQHVMRMVNNEPPPAHTYLLHDGIHLNFDLHSQFSSQSRPELETMIKETLGHSHQFLKTARFLLLTYGTSWVYERLETGEPVANCHKMPATLFKKMLLTQKRLLESFEEMHKALQAFNPDVRLILTVSPVRHLKDTLELNSVSKSILRLTCHTLSELYPNVAYFPAYEIQVDDLRDYRFYDSDLLHPSADAIDYIWKKFSVACFDEPTRTMLEKWNKILKSISHSPFHVDSPSHQKFIHETLKALEELKTQINVTDEIDLLKSQLTKP